MAAGQESEIDGKFGLRPANSRDNESRWETLSSRSSDHARRKGPNVGRTRDHLGIERRVLSSGTHTFNVYVDPVEIATHVFIDYEIAGKTHSAEVR